MSEMDQLARRFEADRPHLRAVAQRMLGSAAEADDAVQEAWLRLSRSDTSAVTNLTGWLTTVVSRVCLDMLRSRAARREDIADLPEAPAAAETQPENEALLSDAIGPALLLVLDTLAPGERLAFVLHDLFAVPFPQIAEIAGCSPAAARQLASRARRKVQGREAEEDRARSRTVVEAFLAAARGGDFAALLALLDPEVVVRADAAAVRTGANELVRGANAAAETFSGRARHAEVALLDGEAGLVWAPGGTPRVAFAFTLAGGRITGIDLIADPADLGAMEVTLLGG
ncbi:RNA polymerase subunit sigma-70 [Actinoplanes sp. ATCC 53533]|uniref:sigma-70 family RNA polymerase sigma factor n=1 Tax=Actinoplanes sp. ATCC 53533 TaxID=1288362 RepID=UPI000F77B1E3|nr:RNA polymerase subunit sigma-70 [Actinoplanes sp. ATCC 53533]